MSLKKVQVVCMFCLVLVLVLGSTALAQEYLVPAGEGFVRLNNGGTHSYDGITWTLPGVNTSQHYAAVQKGSDPVEKVYVEDYTIFSGSYIIFCEAIDAAGALLSFGKSSVGFVSYTSTTVTGAPGSRVSFVGNCNSSNFMDSDPSFYNDETANGWFHHYLVSNSNHTYTTYFDIPAGTPSGNYDVWMSVPFANNSKFLRKLIITVQTISPPSPPSLVSPIGGANSSGSSINFAWSGVSGATNYWLQISRNSGFSNLFYDGAVGNYAIVAISGFPNDGTVYYWRARAQNSAGWGSYGSSEYFVNGSIPSPSLSSPTNNATDVSINPTLSWSSVSSATSYTLQVSTNSSFSSLLVNQSGISGTSFSVNLNYSTTYYWRVNATNSGSTSGWSSTRSFTTMQEPIVPPDAPTLVSPNNGATNISINPTLSWNASARAVSYSLQVSTNSSFSSPVVDQSGISGTSYSVSVNLSYNTTYYWRVNATNSGGTSGWSSTRSFTTMQEPVVKPDPPVLVSPNSGATNISTNPTLSWNASARAVSYFLQVSTNSSFSSLVVNQSGLSGTSYSVSVNLNYSTTYYWRVNATNSGGTSDWSSTRSFITMQEPVVKPDDPVLVSPNNGAFNVSINPTLSWNASARAVSYSLQVSTNSSFSSLVVNQSGLSGTSYSVSVNLNYNTTYYWRVNATNSGGTSGWSSRSFTTMQEPVVKPDDPVLVSPNNGAFNVSINPTLSWNASARAVSYFLQVSTNSSFSSLVVNQSGITGTSYSVNLNYSTTYYWRVNATNSGGTSGWSSRSFTTMQEIVESSDPPVLLSPSNGATNVSINPTLSWKSESSASSYSLQVSTNSSFSSLVVNQSGITGTSYSVNLNYSTTYYWRVNASNSSVTSPWSNPFSFATSSGKSNPWFQAITGISHSIIIPLEANPTIDAIPLADGDLIGVFYDSSGISACGGFDTWTGRGNIVISAVGNDATTPVKDGFNEGEKFQWKIWRQSDGKSFEATAIFQPIGALNGIVYSTDTFMTNGLSALSGLAGNSISMHQISYRAGWNLISSYVEPRAAQLDSVFSSNKSDLILLKNGMQRTYLPSQNINQIGNWISSQGYQAKFVRSGTMTIKGRTLVPEETNITLTSGWNILPYLRSAEMPIATALAPIKDAIVIVKDQDGKTYLPSVNINQIGTMKPGQAYQIKVLQSRTFSYPAASLAMGRLDCVSDNLGINSEVGGPDLVCPWVNPITGTSHTILLPTWIDQRIDASVQLEAGDAAGVFYDSSGVQACAGYAFWDGISNIAISAAGDDPTTPAKDGFTVGDSLRWQIWKQSTGEVLHIKPSFYSIGSLNAVVTSEATFEVNGISAISSFILTDVLEPTGTLPFDFLLAQNYPNPFNPSTTLAFELPAAGKVALVIFNESGRLVRVLQEGFLLAGRHRLRWDGCNDRGEVVPSGLYFAQLRTGSAQRTIKMVMLK